MLLGDRSFVERDRVDRFPKDGRLSRAGPRRVARGRARGFFYLGWAAPAVALFSANFPDALGACRYAGIVEDRPPILRAVLMAALYLSRAAALSPHGPAERCGAFRARDSRRRGLRKSRMRVFCCLSLRLRRLARLPFRWIARSSQPYCRGLDHLSDVTRDVSTRRASFSFGWKCAPLRRGFPLGCRALDGAFWTGIVAPPFRAGLYFWEIVFVSAMLQLGMLPPLAYYFHRVTLAGPFANVPAVLLTGLAVPDRISHAGRFACFSDRIAGPACKSCLGIDSGVAGCFGALVRRLARGQLPHSRAPFAVIAVFVALAIAALGRDSFAVGSVVAAGERGDSVAGDGRLIATYPFAPRLAAKRLELTVLDVGQGDSLFVSLSRRAHDAGGWRRRTGSFHSGGMRSGIDIGEDVVSPYLWSRGIKQIDVMALTHAHEDHLGGLAGDSGKFSRAENSGWDATFKARRTGRFWTWREHTACVIRH